MKWYYRKYRGHKTQFKEKTIFSPTSKRFSKEEMALRVRIKFNVALGSFVNILETVMEA